MMSSSHAFFFHLPNLGVFIVLIVVWVLFRGFLLRGRGRMMARMERRGMVMPPPQLHGQIRCPRCSAGAPAIASFCPHCGLSLTGLPAALGQGQSAQRPARNGLLLLVLILLGAIGLGAYLFWRLADDSPAMMRPAPPVRMHDYYYHR